MEKSPKRGKIPPQDWPSIISRYEAGETLASIARTYDCSPPAISYIVSRTRARHAAADALGPAAAAEPQLVKKDAAASLPSAHPTLAVAGDSPPAGNNASDAPSLSGSRAEEADPPLQQEVLRLFSDSAAAAPALRRESAGEPMHSGQDVAERQDARPREPQADGGNGPRWPMPTGTPPASGESRRTLHLSLSGGDTQHRQDRESHAAPNPVSRPAAEHAASPPPNIPPGAGPAVRPYPPALGNGAPLRSPQEPPGARGGGTFIDRALRERVGGDVAAFLAAFDAALDHDSAESRTGLREATDRLLRAGARTRIELERLEARLPLVPRDKGGQEAHAFRPR
jgi:hypothetical protein